MRIIVRFVIVFAFVINRFVGLKVCGFGILLIQTKRKTKLKELSVFKTIKIKLSLRLIFFHQQVRGFLHLGQPYGEARGGRGGADRARHNGGAGVRPEHWGARHSDDAQDLSLRGGGRYEHHAGGSAHQ